MWVCVSLTYNYVKLSSIHMNRLPRSDHYCRRNLTDNTLHVKRLSNDSTKLAYHWDLVGVPLVYYM